MYIERHSKGSAGEKAWSGQSEESLEERSCRIQDGKAFGKKAMAKVPSAVDQEVDSHDWFHGDLMESTGDLGKSFVLL